MDTDLLKSIRILALYRAENPTYASVYARICRWYSREFSTSLIEVENLPEEYVFQTYYDDLYDQLAQSDKEEDAQKLEQIKEYLLGETPIVQQAAQEDEQWYQEMLKEIEKEKKKPKILPESELKTQALAKPNLIDETLSIHAPGESGPPDFTDDE